MRERVRALGGVVVVALVALTATSCTRPNPLYHPNADGGAGTGGGGGTGGNGGNGGGSGACPTGAVQTCPYTGPAGTNGKGICRAGVQYCIDGVWQACLGEVAPLSESCNLVDDDCNSSIDDGFPASTCGLGTCAKT